MKLSKIEASEKHLHEQHLHDLSLPSEHVHHTHSATPVFDDQYIADSHYHQIISQPVTTQVSPTRYVTYEVAHPTAYQYAIPV